MGLGKLGNGKLGNGKSGIGNKHIPTFQPTNLPIYQHFRHSQLFDRAIARGCYVQGYPWRERYDGYGVPGGLPLIVRFFDLTLKFKP